MKLYKNGKFALIEQNGHFFRKKVKDWDQLDNRRHLFEFLRTDLPSWEKTAARGAFGVEPPIGRQEIWAAGVTYQRSKEARMEEAREAGGGDFYDRVYHAERPELFFKATAARTVGSGGAVNIRRDSTWNVPEPELTLFISSEGTIEGYTIGNDMSSRSIEGENPLYLPQAKVYDRCAGLGPCLFVPGERLSPQTKIGLTIIRKGDAVFSGTIGIDRIKRSLDNLVGYLFRECSFPHGCFLMTGTGIVPPDDFTLVSGDEIRISIENIGTLINFVETRQE